MVNPGAVYKNSLLETLIGQLISISIPIITN